MWFEMNIPYITEYPNTSKFYYNSMHKRKIKLIARDSKQTVNLLREPLGTAFRNNLVSRIPGSYRVPANYSL